MQHDFCKQSFRLFDVTGFHSPPWKPAISKILSSLCTDAALNMHEIPTS